MWSGKLTEYGHGEDRGGEERIKVREFGEQQDKSHLFSGMFLRISGFPFHENCPLLYVSSFLLSIRSCPIAH